MYKPRNAYDAEVIQDLAEKLFFLMKTSDPLTTNVWFVSELKLMDVQRTETALGSTLIQYSKRL